LAVSAFERTARNLEVELKRRGGVVPDDQSVQTLTDAFWIIWTRLGECLSSPAARDLSVSRDLLTEQRQQLIVRLMPVLCRSRYFWRSMLMPHGFPGDYCMLEWMYDLEHAPGNDSTQPAFVNALDRVYSSIHSVQAVWERRRWLSQHLIAHLADSDGAHILDVACGGARYIVEALTAAPRLPRRIVVVDQDPSAVLFASRALDPWQSILTAASIPLKGLPALLRGAPPFSLAISAGLFDYLDDSTATHLLRTVSSAVRPGGRILITNFHPSDPSRLPKTWGAAWDINYRDEAAVCALFPENVSVTTCLSENGALVLATGEVRIPVMVSVDSGGR
jgi:SAM-dependent methyltransferase